MSPSPHRGPAPEPRWPRTAVARAHPGTCRLADTVCGCRRGQSPPPITPARPATVSPFRLSATAPPSHPIQLFRVRSLILLCQFAPAFLYLGHGRETDKAAEDGRGAVRGLSGGDRGGAWGR